MVKTKLMALGMSIALVSATGLTASAAATPGSGATAAPAQTFTGGGSGLFDTSFRDEPTYTGSYTSTGQLGSGHFVVDTGIHTAARFVRSDGTTLSGTAVENTPSECGTPAPNLDCIRVDVTGTADVASARVVIAARIGTLTALGYQTTFLLHGTIAPNRRLGYAMLDANGTVFAFGGFDHLGGAPTIRATDLERTPSGNGYWIVNALGNVYAFGDAPYLGNLPTTTLAPGETVTSMSTTPSGRGYWLFTSRGRVFTFGDARSFGDLRSVALNGRIVGSVATPTGGGYYMVGADGGVFAFGDARFRGSMGKTVLNQPVVGLVPTPDNSGYWLIASDGGVFSFNASFSGSMGGVRLNRPIVAMVPYGGAYLMIGSDGGLFNFSAAPFFGSKGSAPIPVSVVNGASVSWT